MLTGEEHHPHHLQQSIAIALTQLETNSDLSVQAAPVVRRLRQAGVDFAGLNVYLIDRDQRQGRNYYLEPGPAGWVEVGFNEGMAPWAAFCDAHLRQWPDPASPRPLWYLIVPNLRGVVELSAYRNEAFGADELSFIQTVAPLLTLLALRHRDLEQVAAARSGAEALRADLEALRRNTAELSGLEPDEVARRVVQSIVERGTFDRAGLFLVDEAQGILRGTWGIDHHGALADISTTEMLLHCPDPQQLSEAARIVHGTLDHYLTQDLDGERRRSAEGNIGANLGVPMCLGRRVLGVLAVDNHFSRRPIHADQILPLKALANQAALAIDHSRLHLALRAEEAPVAAPTRARSTPGLGPFEGIVAQSPAMRKVVELARLATTTDHTVLILGESGTGKGLLAHAIHAQSRRRLGPLTVVNSASLSSGLEDSELFGHVKGAFTSAIRDNTGLVASANGGTLFLDEIGDLSPSSQAKLLRTLEDGEVRRVGDSRVQKVDVRCIAATNRDLRRAIGEGSFRPDLYYRLAVITIWIPPLRERPEDIPLLAAQFLERIGREVGRNLELSPALLDLLTRCPWPGNARELQSCLRHAVLLAGEGPIGKEHLPEDLLQGLAEGPAAGTSLADLERRHILEVLEQCGGDRLAARAQLGISRATLQRRLKDYGLTP